MSLAQGTTPRLKVSEDVFDPAFGFACGNTVSAELVPPLICASFPYPESDIMNRCELSCFRSTCDLRAQFPGCSSPTAADFKPITKICIGIEVEQSISVFVVTGHLGTFTVTDDHPILRLHLLGERKHDATVHENLAIDESTFFQLNVVLFVLVP